MIELGVNSVLFGGFDFATACRYIKLAGYDGVEISAIKGMCEHLVLDSWREQKDEIKRIVEENGLKILSMEVASLDEDRLIKAFEASAELGIPIVNVGPGGKSDVPEDLENSITKLKKMSEKAKDYGVILCVKAHVGSAIYNTPTTLYAMSKIDSKSFGIDMDPSHIYRSGENPEDAVLKVLPRVRHIHIRDCKGRTSGPGSPFMQVCGRGDINLMAFCKNLVDGGYSGPICLEVIGALQLPLPEVVAIASESYGYLNAIFKYIGVR